MSRHDASFERLRMFEVAQVVPLLPPGGRLLDIGGGAGIQAKAFADAGMRVTSIDLASRPRPLAQVFEVRDYDGRAIPFPDASFDAVYSSSVLEHVTDLRALLVETRRVLAPGGVAVHLVPGRAWRFWTLLAHYGFVLKRLIDSDAQPSGGHVDSPSEKARQRGWGHVVRRALMPGPHGEFPTALHELVAYSAPRWKRRLVDAGFEVQSNAPVGVFATGYGLAPGLSLAWRRRLARVLGSVQLIVIARKPE